MSDLRVLRSQIDASINYVQEIGPGEALEARYVRRRPEYVACYISCQTACRQSCKMCHLTFTGQNKPRDATRNEMYDQALRVLDSIPAGEQPSVVHYNFMARGEPLVSKVILEESESLFMSLGRLAQSKGMFPRFLISSIIPADLPRSFTDLFPIVQPEIYYSLYSMDPGFRRRWLPKAMDPGMALDMLTDWQRQTKKIVRIHYALIEGENDRWDDVVDISVAVKKRGLRADFTLIQYNPPSDRHGKESDRYEKYIDIIQSILGERTRTKIIDRVGYDVAASCGTFIQV